MTKWQLHVTQWRSCERCWLHETRKQVVLCRGSVPADVVFIGEAPGESENVVGRPFVGPAGQVLDKIIAEALRDKYTYCVTNLVGCIPRDPDDNSKLSKPDAECVVSCAPRLQEVVQMCDPKLLVLVGTEAKDYTIPGIRGNVEFHKPIHRVEVVHPAWILRQSAAMRDVHVRRSILAIQAALEEIENPIEARPAF